MRGRRRRGGEEERRKEGKGVEMRPPMSHMSTSYLGWEIFALEGVEDDCIDADATSAAPAAPDQMKLKLACISSGARRARICFRIMGLVIMVRVWVVCELKVILMDIFVGGKNRFFVFFRVKSFLMAVKNRGRPENGFFTREKTLILR